MAAESDEPLFSSDLPLRMSKEATQKEMLG
jgi:hypothetical protein